MNKNETKDFHENHPYLSATLTLLFFIACMFIFPSFGTLVLISIVIFWPGWVVILLIAYGLIFDPFNTRAIQRIEDKINQAK